MRKGSASITMDYNQGEIKVFHGENKELLASWTEPESVNNHWDMIWSLIDNLVIKNDGYRKTY